MSGSRELAGSLAGNIVATFTSRGQTYGPPEINFQNIANFWNAWLEARYGKAFMITIDATDVGHMSALIKKARLANSPTHEDSALDDATYTLLAAGVASVQLDAGVWKRTKKNPKPDESWADGAPHTTTFGELEEDE